MKKFEITGEVLRLSRLDINMTQKELGEKIEVSSQFISNAERGLCELPPRALRKIAKMNDSFKVNYSLAMFVDAQENSDRKARSIFK